MPSLAQQLGTTAPLSPLLRKARRLGILDLPDALALAAIRGCRHYPFTPREGFSDPGNEVFSDEELAILLLLGELPYNPMAIRCAAQLVRSPSVRPRQLARLGRQSATVRPLAHIARAGLAHDPDGQEFWETLLQALAPPPHRAEPALPHWSRFVSAAGYHPNGPRKPVWLVPSR